MSRQARRFSSSSSALIALVTTTNTLYAQAIFLRKGAAVGTVTALIGAGNLVNALGGILGGRVASRNDRAILIWGGTMLGVACILTGALSLPWGGAAFCRRGDLACLRRSSHRLSSRVRATVLSFENAAFSFLMIVTFPILGCLLGTSGPAAAYGGLGALAGVAALLVRHLRVSGYDGKGPQDSAAVRGGPRVNSGMVGSGKPAPLRGPVVPADAARSRPR